MRFGLPLTKKILAPSGKSVLIPLGLSAPASATDTAIQKKIFGSGMASYTDNCKWRNEKYYETTFAESGSLIKGVSETIEN